MILHAPSRAWIYFQIYLRKTYAVTLVIHLGSVHLYRISLHVTLINTNKIIKNRKKITKQKKKKRHQFLYTMNTRNISTTTIYIPQMTPSSKNILGIRQRLLPRSEYRISYHIHASLLRQLQLQALPLFPHRHETGKRPSSTKQLLGYKDSTTKDPSQKLPERPPYYRHPALPTTPGQSKQLEIGTSLSLRHTALPLSNAYKNRNPAYYLLQKTGTYKLAQTARSY
jgi:hypothetical protein